MALIFSAALRDYQQDALDALDVVPVTLEPIYRLTWIDAALHDAPPGALASTHERSRDFLYLGAAIAWARRRIFHGHVFGDVIEMIEVNRTRRGDKINEMLGQPVDITLPGFVRWVNNNAYDQRDGYRIGAAERKCRWDQ